jgi:hypothetical protein
MKERPILFSGPMVRAILEGRKTMTRRVVKPQPYISENGVKCWGPPTDGRKYLPNGPRSATGGYFFTMTDLIGRYCPYGLKGDRLWVRETFTYRCDDGCGTVTDEIVYAADGEEMRAVDADGFEMYRKDGTAASCWIPSIFMHRFESRITLEVTGVRVERLQEITGSDARLEGCPDKYVDGCDKESMDGMSRWWFQELWDSINSDRPKLPKNVNSKRYVRVKRWLEKHPPCAWDNNPWVWVVEFKRIEEVG